MTKLDKCWDIDLDIKTPGDIKECDSNYSGSNVTRIDEKHIRVEIKDSDYNQDIILTYRFDSTADSYIIIQHDERVNKHAFHLSITPQQSKEEIDDWEPRGEFIILLDRSGSMMGDSIQLAKEAVCLFIKSLPEDSYFNVISFGSGFKMLSNESMRYEGQNIKNAIEKVKNYDADMGGTEIFDALNMALKAERKAGYPLFLFLLTDGEINNTSQVLELIMTETRPCKISTIGIGSGVSTYLINEVAKFGKGSSQLIYNVNEIKPAVVSSLKKVLIPGISSIQVTNKDDFELLGPSNPFDSFFGNKITYSGILNNNDPVQELTLKYRDDQLDQEITLSMPLLLSESVSSSSALVLAVKKSFLNSTTQDIITNSVRYQVLSPYTAFLGIEKVQRKILKTSSRHCLFDEESERLTDMIPQSYVIPQSCVEYESFCVGSAPVSIASQSLFNEMDVDQTFEEIEANYTCLSLPPPINTFAASSPLPPVPLSAPRLPPPPPPPLSAVRPPPPPPLYVPPPPPLYVPPPPKIINTATEALKRLRNSLQKQCIIEEGQKQQNIIMIFDDAHSSPELIDIQRSPSPKYGRILDSLIDLQLANGMWEYSVDLENLIKSLIAKDLADKSDQFVTLLVLSILTEKFKDYEDVWDLIVAKTRRWLKKNGLQQKSIAELTI